VLGAWLRNRIEGHPEVKSVAFGEQALGLLEDDPTRQGVLQLPVDDLDLEWGRRCETPMAATMAMEWAIRWSIAGTGPG
jgi:hypothetical protein